MLSGRFLGVISDAPGRCQCHLDGRSFRASCPPLTRRKLCFAILAAVSFQRRSIGMGNAPHLTESLNSSFKKWWGKQQFRSEACRVRHRLCSLQLKVEFEGNIAVGKGSHPDRVEARFQADCRGEVLT